MQANDPSLKHFLIKEQAVQFRANREQLGLTQDEMAECLDNGDERIVKRTIQRWEKGETPLPGWAISQQEHMLKYFGKAETKLDSKKAILAALNDVSGGFFQEAKEKIRRYLQK